MSIRIYKDLKFIDLSGKKFGKLTVIKYNPKIKRFKEWLCKCDCGAFVYIRQYKLIYNHVYSCGCTHLINKHGLRRLHSKRQKEKEKLDYLKLDFYKKWYNIKQQCDYSYGFYKKKGISYDSRWKDFLEFKKDMYFNYLFLFFNKRIKKISLIRIDSNKDFSKDNCKFIPFRRYFQTEKYRQEVITPILEYFKKGK